MGRRKKKKNNLMKAGIISFISAALVWNWFSNNVIGKSPVRKALFYTSIGALFLYNSCGDEIGNGINSAYKKTYELFNNPIREENTLLSQQIERKNIEMDSFRDSLIELNSPEEVLSQYSSPSAEKKEDFAEHKIKSATYWYVVKEGDNLSEIAGKYYGRTDLYKEVAELNGISNPANVEVGFPLLLNKKNLVSTRGLRSDETPERTTIMRKGEDVSDIIFKITGEESRRLEKNVLEYNNSKGNFIPKDGYNHLQKAVVYLPKNIR